MIGDVREALRSLRARPQTSALAIGCLAVGIGANVVLFGVVDALMFRPPVGVGDPSTLVRVRTGGPVSPLMAAAGSVDTYPTFVTVREERAGFVDVAAYGRGPATLDGGADARGVSTQAVSSNFFEVMGVRPVLGRFFAAAEGEPLAAIPVAVLGHRFWRSAFGGSRDAVGGTLRVGASSLTIVGVAPPGFEGADLGGIDFWVPMGMAGEPGFGGGYGPGSGWIQMVGRLRPGLTLDAALARLESEGAGRESLTVIPFTEADIGRPTLPMAIALIPLRTMFFGDTAGETPVPAWALGISGAVLLLACATVGNLLLAQAVRRRRDVAVRLSLGASPARILRGQLTESALLALAAVGASALVAWLSLGLARKLPTPPLGPVLGPRAALFGVAVALATPLLFGVAPALWAARRDVGEVLKTSGGGSAPARLQRALMAAQTAIAFALLLVAGLFLGSLEKARAIPLGWDAERTLLIHLDPWVAWWDVERAALLTHATEALERVPGVVAAATGAFIPFSSHTGGGARIRDGRPDEEQPSDVETLRVGPGFFRTLDVPVVSGRVIDERDRAGAPLAAMVSQSFARRFFAGRSPLGACVDLSPGVLRGALDGRCAEVVGVAADARFDELFGESRPVLYLAGDQIPARSFGDRIFVRVDGRPADFIAAIRAAVQGAHPDMPFPHVEPMSVIMDRPLYRWRVAAGLFGVMGLLALALAAVGVHGLASFIADQRGRELGIRSALGAGRQRLLALVLWDGARVSLAGLALGTAIALAVARVLASRLYGTSWANPTTYLAVAAGLLAISAAAGTRPAVRASRADPVVVLREE